MFRASRVANAASIRRVGARAIRTVPSSRSQAPVACTRARIQTAVRSHYNNTGNGQRQSRDRFAGASRSTSSSSSKRRFMFAAGAVAVAATGAAASVDGVYTYDNNGKDWSYDDTKQQAPIIIEIDSDRENFKPGSSCPYTFSFNNYHVALNRDTKKRLQIYHSGDALKVKLLKDGEMPSDDHPYVLLTYRDGTCTRKLKYYAKEFHFHAPAEHRLVKDGVPQDAWPLEVHIVHKPIDDVPAGAPVAIPVGAGYAADSCGVLHENPWLSLVGWHNSTLPTEYLQTTDIQHPFSLSDMLFLDPHKRQYPAGFVPRQDKPAPVTFLHYEAGLTTPPFGYPSLFLVRSEPLVISEGQAEAMARHFEGNDSFAKGKGNNRTAFKKEKKTELYALHVGEHIIITS